MKQTRTRLFLVMLLSLPAFVQMQARDMQKQNPLRVVLKEAKRMHTDMTKDDYRLCLYAMKGKKLSVDELQRVAEVCDQVLDSAKNMSDTEIARCRDALAEQLAEHRSTRAPREPLTTVETEPVDDPHSLAGSDVETFITNNGIAQTTNNTLSILGSGSVTTSGDGATLIIDSAGGGGGSIDFKTDNGMAEPSGNEITFAGDSVIEVFGSGDTVTTHLQNGADGQVLMSGGSQPTWANITSTDNSINITNGPNNIDLSSNVDTSLDFQADSGIATPSGSTIIIEGINDVSTIASGSIITIDTDIDNTLDVQTDDGVAEPSNGIIKAVGDGNVIQTSTTSGNTIQTELLNGMPGQVLMSGGSQPTWADITSTDNSIIINEGSNSIDLSSNAGTGSINFEDDNAAVATPSSGTIVIAGGANGITTDASGNTVTVNIAPCTELNNDLLACDGIRKQNGSIENDSTSIGLNVALRKGQAKNFEGSAAFNFASRDAIATSTDASNGFNFAAGGFNATAESVSSDGFNFAAGSNTTVVSDNDSSGFNFAATSASAKSAEVSSGFNFAANDAMATSSNVSHGFNFAALRGEATSLERSSGFNFASNEAIATGSNISNGFNFAANGSRAINRDNSHGFNFATCENSSLPGVATSTNDSAGFNFAAGDGADARSDSTQGFNCAAEGAMAMSANGSNGFNLAAGYTTITNTRSNSSMLFTLGLGNDYSSINHGTSEDSFTVAVAGAQATDPQEGVNFYINHSENSDSNLRFHDLPDADNTNDFILAVNSDNEVRVSSLSPGGSTPSSKRFKEDIAEIDGLDMDQLKTIHPVTFRYKNVKNNRASIGFIAEEIAEKLPESITRELVIRDSEGKPYGLKYDKFVPVLHKFMQMQQEEISSQDDKVKQLEKENNQQGDKIEQLEKENEMRDMLIKECFSRLAAIETS